MKKAILTLAVLVMAFGNVGLAQNMAKLPEMDKQVMRYYGVRHNGDLRPAQAVVAQLNGDKSRYTYTYDEYDYYLIEEFVENYNGTDWQPAEMVTYEYDFDGNVLEQFGQVWNGSGWENATFTSYTYEDYMVKEVIYQTWDGSNWVNDTKKVYDYQDSVSTILFWKWNGSTWSSDELYTYTYDGNTIELVVQYMQGGAWQNKTRYIYTLDFSENITEITIEAWVNYSMWDYMENLVYDYQDGVYVSMSVYFGYGDPQYRMEYAYEDGNAVLGEATHRLANGQYAPYEGEIEMAYGFNYDVIRFYGSVVELTYLDVTKVDENAQTVSFKVYPVPAENEIQIQAEGFQKAEIFTLTGQMLLESEQNSMNVSSLASGIYLLKVYDQTGNSAMQKLVVK